MSLIHARAIRQTDVIVYQVPERSRAHELLVELLEEKGLDWVDIVPTKRERDEQKEAKADADIRSV